MFLFFVQICLCALLHELGHFTVLHSRGLTRAIVFGPKIGKGFERSWGRYRFRIYPLFPVIVGVEVDARKLRKQNLLFQATAFLAGPLANLLAAFCWMMISGIRGDFYGGIPFTTVNVAVAISQIIPIPPSDGWYVLTSTLMAAFPKRKEIIVQVERKVNKAITFTW